MFENILFHNQICTELTDEISNNALPPSLLIHGEALSGKSTLALELARILTCQAKTELGKWTCSCWSCEQQRELTQSQVLILGSSDFLKEVQVCRYYLELGWQEHLELKQLRILLLVWLRSLNKILKRYDKELWEDSKSKTEKERKAQKVQEEFLELLTGLRPKELLDQDPASGVPFLHDTKNKLTKSMDRCEELAKILVAAIPQGVPVQQIRQLQHWSYQTSETSKVAILENVDMLNLAASNAMLKLLEEPPQGCYFILTSRRKQALLPTVLSRLRLVGLGGRSNAEEQQIVQRVFRTQQVVTLKELFLSGKQDYSTIQAECELFLHSLREKRPFFSLRQQFANLDLEVFLQNLSFVLQRECMDQHRHADSLLAEHRFFWYQKFLQLGRQAVERHRVYHDPPLFLLQNLYLALLHETGF